MMDKKGGIVVVAMASMMTACTEEPECGEFPLDDDQRHCVVETIDQMVAETYPFAGYKGVDLGDFSRNLHQVAEGDHDSDDDFLRAVNSVVMTLDDGHTRMERRALEEPATARVDLRRIDDEVVVISARDGYREWIGETVVAIDGVDAATVLDEADPWMEAGVDGEAGLSGSRLALAGEKGSSLRLQMESGATVTMSRRSMFNEPEVARFGGDIGYIHLDTFGFIDDLDAVDEAIDAVMDTRALIIDLRGNGGGFPSVVDGLFGRLVEEDKPSFRMIDVNGQLHRTLDAPSRGDTYDGEVVVLSDHRTYSASNYFAHLMTYHDRGILIGESTGGGAAAPARGKELLPGIWFQVSTYVVKDPDGRHTESGIEPTLPVDVESHDESDEDAAQPLYLYPTGDPVKDRALQYLNGRT